MRRIASAISSCFGIPRSRGRKPFTQDNKRSNMSRSTPQGGASYDSTHQKLVVAQLGARLQYSTPRNVLR